MESENTCEQSFQDDPENDGTGGLAEEASTEVGQEVSATEQESSGAEQALQEAGEAGSAENAEADADSVDSKEKSADNDLSKEKTDDSKVTKTVAQHYNELRESGLEARGNSRIFYLRNFNNWIKSVLIGDTLQKVQKERSCDQKYVVLDMCSGKGGDMLKWKKGRISKLVCVDIASTSVEQSEARFKDIVERNQNSKRREQIFDAEFITADVSKQRLKDMYKDPSISFDLVSCQFALHYSFESYSQADMMMKNVAECLQPGGYFIGTTPNSYELVNRLRKSETNSFGNDVYKVEFLSEDKDNLPLFGSQYSFQLEGVVDCPEFLVYFPALVKLAEKYDMKLVEKQSFSDYFKKHHKTSENRTLLGRMQALEPYPAENYGKLISSNEKDYAFAKEALDKDLPNQQQSNRRPVKVGTLSEPEWKAISLYMVFVFQKVGDQKDEPKAEVEESAEQEEETHGVKRSLSEPEEEEDDDDENKASDAKIIHTVDDDE
ncbi:mRNA cap guanine-N7 methyltransferase [Octopus vulgaris]|uniref:mRNA cap guanine-N(7) methyltransferase n=1 Tax=Octopus vulgaris TaxID=6645 RepID=A0AA36BPT8_OCTVU|nr:mRNA cap guanine-N7 methyltransferase [Octopus vulgaris]CAI9737412.1 mRNA cap guanine-N7 methyltransferase [Octopus vulgaris]